MQAQLQQQAERLQQEAAANLAKEVGAARLAAEQAANESFRERDAQLVREKAAVDGELAATRRQLDEANERAGAAERRALELEVSSRREAEHDREERFQEVEGKLGSVADEAGTTSQRAREDAAAVVGAEPPAPPEPEPAPPPARRPSPSHRARA